MSDAVAPEASLASLRSRLTEAADPDRAPAMERYMKGRAVYLGVAVPDVHRIARPFVAAGRDLDGPGLIAAADECWGQPEREFHYAAIDLLRRWVDRLGPGELAGVERLIRTRSWWDTVDLLASRVVGPIVAEHPPSIAIMDRWIADDDIWIARAAILHQLAYRERTDPERLFGYVDRRSADTEFFIRKACGWALREYAKTDPGAVRAYVDSRGEHLSGLTRREATRHLG